jgi:hypothetical protein
LKHGCVSLASQNERSQTPSGPAESWHCTPDSVHVSAGPPDSMLESQATDASSDPSRTARRIMGCESVADSTFEQAMLSCESTSCDAPPCAAQRIDLQTGKITGNDKVKRPGIAGDSGLPQKSD